MLPSALCGVSPFVLLLFDVAVFGVCVSWCVCIVEAHWLFPTRSTKVVRTNVPIHTDKTIGARYVSPAFDSHTFWSIAASRRRAHQGKPLERDIGREREREQERDKKRERERETKTKYKAIVASTMENLI